VVVACAPGAQTRVGVVGPRERLVTVDGEPGVQGVVAGLGRVEMGGRQHP
jgi:hypothetical protein